MIRVLALSCILVLLAACSTSAPATADADANAAPASATTNALAGTPMAEYGHALNKAKNVQNIVNDRARKQAKAINDATGGN
ncbi:MAG TPA: hypothetical protein VJ862_00225 [Rhodanobacteraceae bacterium]|nr:hypothetical protein [Rhodanobacteraceae bacterium]